MVVVKQVYLLQEALFSPLMSEDQQHYLDYNGAGLL